MDTDITPTAQNESDGLREQLESFRSLLNSMLILCIVISGTFNLFLVRQLKDVRTGLEAIRPQANNIIAQYQKSEPLMKSFVDKLTEYGRTHADFAPIMTKYGLKPGSVTTAPPVTAPAPASALPKK